MYSRKTTFYACLVILSILVLAREPYAFPISAQPLVGEAGVSAAGDGNGRYLVGIERVPDTSNGPVAAVLFDQNGSILNTVDTGRIGCCASGASFDGVNFLLIWEDSNGNIQPDYQYQQVWGLLIDTDGNPAGDPFAVSSQGISVDGVNELAFGGDKYLMVYTKLIDPSRGEESDNRYIAGALISTDGSVSSEFRISTGHGHLSTVAFDGTNFFVVWVEDSEDKEIRGRFVSPAGTVGTEISINASTLPSDNPPAVRFGLDSYLVAFNDQRSDGGWDIMGQVVGTDGSLAGMPIAIKTGGSQIVPTIGFDGERYLVAYNDFSKDTSNWGVCDGSEGTCWDLRGRYVSTEGTLIGNPFTISGEEGIEFGGVGGYDDAAGFLVLVNKCGSRFFSSKCDAHGQFISTAQSYVGFLSPKAGETVPSGSTYTARWAASSDISKYTLKLSMDNGLTWSTIASGITDTSYDWPVPVPSNNKKLCLMKITGYDAGNAAVASDKTDGKFSIGVVTLASPAGGETLASGASYDITWTTNTTKNPVAKVSLSYTLDGVNWKPVAPTIAGNPGSYSWTVPAVTTTKTKSRVKVVLRNSAGNAVGSAVSPAFSIQP